MTPTVHGVPAHHLLSGCMRRSLLAFARDHRTNVALTTWRDLESAKLVYVAAAGERHLTRAGLALAIALEEDAKS